MLKVIELFGGIGACSKALERLGIDYEIVDYVEIDKYAVKSFNAIFGTNFEPQDICDWNKDIEADLIMHGSPCQDFSLAGKQAGGDKDSGTRSSLMYETLRIVEKVKPKYVIWENVKNVISKRHRHNFDNYLNKMEELGYKNYWKVLNAKDYGIPQNRERVFTISIRNEQEFAFPKKDDENNNQIERLLNFGNRHSSRVVYNSNGLSPTLMAGMGTGGGNIPMVISENFEFPEGRNLNLKLKDILESEVDEKYYLSEKMINFYYQNEKVQAEKGNGFRFGVSDGNIVAKTVTTRAGSRMDDNFIKVKDSFVEKHYKNFIEKEKHIPEMFNPYNEKEISDIAPTQSTQCGSTTSSSAVLIKNNTKKGYLEAYEGDSINLSYPNSKTRRGRIGKQISQTLQCNNDIGVVVKNINKKARHQQDLVQSEEGLCRTIPAGTHGSTPHLLKTIVNENDEKIRIRKLTPKECWRLMGFDDSDFEKARLVNSDTQLYKQAGNSIVVNVLEAILKNLLMKGE